MPPRAVSSLLASRATTASTSPATGCLRLPRASGCTCTLRRFPWQRMTTGEGVSWWDSSAWPGNTLLEGWYPSLGPHPTQLSDQPRSCRSPGPGSSSAMGTMWRPRPCMIPTRWSTCPLRACSAPADTSLWSSVLTAVGRLQAWPCAMRVSLLGPNWGWGSRAWGLFSHPPPLPPFHHHTFQLSPCSPATQVPSPYPSPEVQDSTPSFQETPAWTQDLWSKRMNSLEFEEQKWPQPLGKENCCKRHSSTTHACICPSFKKHLLSTLCVLSTN